jgi:hypothetical protein
MNGNTRDSVNLQNKALRGIQITDKDGAVQFDTILPGHYMGRTPHVHGVFDKLGCHGKKANYLVMTHLDQQVLPNNTIQGGRIAHIGQVFFDQELLDEAGKLPVYQGNKAPKVRNNQDFIMAFDTAGGFDPVVEYVPLGKTLEDGIFAWINFGINGTNSRSSARKAADCFADGCKAQTGGLFGNMGKGGKGKGGFPFPFMGKEGEGRGKGGMPGMLPPGMSMPTELPKGLVMGGAGKFGGLANMLSGLLGLGGKGATPVSSVGPPKAAKAEAPAPKAAGV